MVCYFLCEFFGYRLMRNFQCTSLVFFLDVNAKFFVRFLESNFACVVPLMVCKVDLATLLQNSCVFIRRCIFVCILRIYVYVYIHL